MTTAVPEMGSWDTTPGPLKAYVCPPPAVRVTLVWAQVSVPLADSVAVGAGVTVIVRSFNTHTFPVPPFTHSAVKVYEVGTLGAKLGVKVYVVSP